MKKRAIIFLLMPLLLTACVHNNGKTSTPGGNSEAPNTSEGGGGDQSIAPSGEGDEYDAWLNSWSQPNHLYFHYNRGDKGGYIAQLPAHAVWY